VQALLLLSRREPPGVEQLREERRQAQRAAGALVSSQVATPVADMDRVSRETIAIAYTGAPAPHLADLSHPEPFWPGTRHPGNSLLLTLGNEVIVSAFPAELAFLLYCVVCGTDSPAFSWEISKMADSGEAERGTPIVSSQPSPLHMQNLGSIATLGPSAAPSVRVAQVREPMQVTLAEPGLYAVTVRLNGAEAGRLALCVQLAPHKPSP
jgi:hypothetical protein